MRVQRTEVNAVPPALYDTTIRMCIDKNDTSKDNNQLWMRQQNLLLGENIPCICSCFDEATLLAGDRKRRIKSNQHAVDLMRIPHRV